MNKNTGNSTEELLNSLMKEQNLARFFSKTGVQIPSFNEYITQLSESKGLTHEYVIKKANLEKSYGHKIFAGTRNPSRDTVIMLAFGFSADIEVAQTLLKYAGKSPLYPKLKRDAAVLYCLHNKKSIEKTQIILLELGLPILGEGK